MSISVNNYLEHGKSEISTEKGSGNYIWLRLGMVSNTISLEQAEDLLVMLAKAVEDYKAGN